MATYFISGRSLLLTSMTALYFVGTTVLAAAQAANVPHSGSIVGGYRIAGMIVSKTDGHPLAQARISVRDVKAPAKLQFVITSEDGKFEFTGLAAGKYSLVGQKRGFVPAAYDQHDQFSTAIVTGAGLETEALVLKIAPTAIISGRVLDETGDPVRHASVTSYYDDHSGGIDQIRPSHTTQTDDQGWYEITSLNPGTYFLSASAKPWYAVHPSSNQTSPNQADTFRTHPDSSPSASDQTPPAPSYVDRSLDVAYPLTYYSDVTEADDASPIPIRGGEHVQVDIHFTPVPSLRLLFRVPNNGDHGFTVPRLEQPTFEGSTFLQPDGTRIVTPGVIELTGIPAGRYNVRINGQGAEMQMNGVALSKDGEEIDTSSGEAVSTVKVSAQVAGEVGLPEHMGVSLRPGHRLTAGGQQFNVKGETELQRIPAGRYEVLLWGTPKPYSIAHMVKDGATVPGHWLTVAPGSSVSVSLTLIGGSSDIEGSAKRAGKPFAGAMVVLVPKNAEDNRYLFRRDQSDLDGTFALHNVVPGSYTILAIENGWDLDWSQPGVISVYVPHGRAIEVESQRNRAMNLAEAVEVQSK